jgi:hypothetical protein
MRCSKAAVAVSLTFNLLLASAYLLGFPRPPKSSDRVIEEASASRKKVQIVEKNRTNIVAVAAPARVFDWHTVESEDYREYIANLRKIGCPEKTIRDVIVADVNDLYRERYRKLFPTTNRVGYWKPGNPLANLFDEEMIATQRVLQVEKRDLIRTILGAPYTDEDDLSAIQLDSYSERLLNFLTPEKRTAMKELEDTFAVKMMKTYRDTWRGNDEPAKAVLAEKDEAMLKVMTPDEKFEYDLRRSDTAVVLRVGLKDFELSEEEFRAVFPAIKEFIAAAGKPGFGAMMMGQTDPRPDGAAARAVLQAKLIAALGNQRFQEMIDGTGWDLTTEEQPQP